MRLTSIKLQNFRQFYGINEAKFSGDGNKKVSVIFGENGRGKTGLFRAVVFCLFNERRLMQDEGTIDSEILLINRYALEKSPSEPIKAFVELEFIHKEAKYKMRRQLVGILKGGEVFCEDDEVFLSITYPTGNTKSIAPDEIDSFIHKVMDRRVKDYFLFDGERIEKLTRASVDQRKEIGIGIRKLLNVDSLERAKNAMEKLTKELETQSGGKFSPEYARIVKELNEIEEKQKEQKNRIEQIDNESQAAQSEIDQLDIQLSGIMKIKDLLFRRKDLEGFIFSLKNNAKEIGMTFKDYPKKIAAAIISNTIKNVLLHIDTLKSKGQVPSEIRRDLIERILQEQRCICGNCVKEGNEAYERILAWLEHTSDPRVQESVLDIWRHLGEVNSNIESDRTTAESALVKYGQLKNEVERFEEELEAIRVQIGDADREDALQLEEARRKAKNKLVDLEADRKNITLGIEELARKSKEAGVQLMEEKKKQTIKTELERRAILARETRDALIKTYEEFTDKIKLIISEYATEYFQKLLDEEGLEILKSVVVNDDYSLQVLDRWQKPFLANISAGQRQIMSIAFIIALARAASNDGLLEVPLFMDTPFGRLSASHRENLIVVLSSVASQWILLATDTEFRRKEAAFLQATKNWDKFYVLHQMPDGNTRIEEKSIDDAFTMLRNRE